ncbi:MAG: hypothetical protein LBF37_01760, partial [Rickettsiales bacterium]|nr:hypothetical protein [Rickettsiales bacterium]
GKTITEKSSGDPYAAYDIPYIRIKFAHKDDYDTGGYIDTIKSFGVECIIQNLPNVPNSATSANTPDYSCYTYAQDPDSGEYYTGKIVSMVAPGYAMTFLCDGFPCNIRVQNMNGADATGIVRYTDQEHGIWIPD